MPLPPPSWPAQPLLPVAWGEVFDKLTILEIKHARLTRPEQRANVAEERSAIDTIIGDPRQYPPALAELINELKVLNSELWEIEDGKRACERAQRFDEHFIRLARAVYLKNDRRAAIKREINDLLGSTLKEEKSHSG